MKERDGGGDNDNATSSESLDPAIPKASTLSFQFHQNQHFLFDLSQKPVTRNSVLMG